MQKKKKNIKCSPGFKGNKKGKNRKISPPLIPKKSRKK